jgi:5-methylthioadenosine/S-adenosylhomocysteine deaminase
VFRMATVGGAKTTPFGARLGALEVGKAADMVLIDWRQISYPYLDAETPALDAIVQRAKSEGVKTVIAAGEIIYQNGKFTKVDRDAALRQLSEFMERPLNPGEIERRQLSKAIFPHVKSFYDGYYSNDEHVPYYRQNSRV